MSAHIESHGADLAAQAKTHVIPGTRCEPAAMQEECRRPITAPVERMQSNAAGADQGQTSRRIRIFERDAEPAGELRQGGKISRLCDRAACI